MNQTQANLSLGLLFFLIARGSGSETLSVFNSILGVVFCIISIYHAFTE